MEHSINQLEMMRAAATRLQAEAARTSLHSVFAAVGSAMSGKPTAFERLDEALEDVIYGD